MSYEFKKLSNTEVVATVGDSASILIEENGVIKRAPKDEVGGGVKVASSAKVGQTIVVKAVDENGNPTEWECADRTCWEEGDMTLILPETTWTFDTIGFSGKQQVCDELGLIEGEVYTVVWDGVSYRCVCFSYSGEGIGNYSAIGGPSNGEPFAIWSSGNIFVTEIGTHTFSIYKGEATVHKLDKKYLPDDVYVQADWNENDETSTAYIQNRPFYEKNVETIAIESQTVNLTVSEDYANSDLTYVNYIPWDGICKVIFDGVVYDDIAAYEGGADMCVYVDFVTENGERISICESNFISGPASLAGQHTIEVFIKEIFIQTIDNKFIDYNIKKGTGEYSVILNDGKAASGHCSHAEGYVTTASGNNSHAEGQGTTASGNNSHAEGWNTVASGEDSHAEGYNTTASGKHSHAEGYKTVAQRANQHVQGKFNILDTDGYDVTSSGKYLHIVGNGTSNTKRSNAHTLDWDGNAWYQGTVEGTAMVVKSSTSGSTKRFKITVDDSGTLSVVEVTE